MIDRKGYKAEVFWRRVEKIFGEASKGGHKIAERDTAWRDVDDVIYLGSGYWRCVEEFDEDGTFIGVRMINPSNSREEIDIVEKAFWLIP